MKLLFLFNHDAAHQVAHSIGIAAYLADHHPRIETVIAYGSDDIRRAVEGYLTDDQISRLTWLDLSLGRVVGTALYLFNRLFPAYRLARLFRSAGKLKQSDMIISTERTCLTLKRRWKGEGPKFVFVPHGAGDRTVSYHPALKDFDYMLVSGQKVKDQMIAHDLAKPENCLIIGYPKFDTLSASREKRYFDNDNPVFLYNPHFDPYLSSWYDHGEKILEWFFHNQDRYNLILAPHVMLFLKELHISPEYKKGRLRPGVADKYRNAPNIHVDVDSARLFDMSYTMAADAYIGDVSSQVYEFLYRPRPVFFINTHSEEHSKDEPAYEFWLNGPVVTTVDELFDRLPDHEMIGARYRAEQQRLTEYTMSIDPDRTAAERGAEALANVLGQPV